MMTVMGDIFGSTVECVADKVRSRGHLQHALQVELDESSTSIYAEIRLCMKKCYSRVSTYCFT